MIPDAPAFLALSIYSLLAATSKTLIARSGWCPWARRFTVEGSNAPMFTSPIFGLAVPVRISCMLVIP